MPIYKFRESLSGSLSIGTLSSFLQLWISIAIFGECKNGAEAVRTIQQKKPDLIFLDIQMPDLNGFDVVSHLKSGAHPLIIFVTAFDQYAIKAFDIHAIDYLLKPFPDQPFFEALERAKSQLDLQQTSHFRSKLLNLMDEFYPDQDQYLSTITVKVGQRLRRVEQLQSRS